MNDPLYKKINRNDSLRIVKEYFNAFGTSSDFPEVVQNLISHIGYGNEYQFCRFPDDSEDDEVKFEGVQFRFLEEKIEISDEEFKTILQDAVNRHLRIFPENQKILKYTLLRI